ncbi:unnamed protein product [Linum trigynum]|uniref:Uncharacterized protein n=1 Tax=Linum trigynum TaxID=586398 RepID=A0AAV2FCE9_9ROSI
MKRLATQMVHMGALFQTMAEQRSSSSSPVQQSSSSYEVDIELEDESKDATTSGKFLEGNIVVSPTPEPEKEEGGFY